MVCNRCVLIIENILRQLEIPYHQILVGEIHLYNDLDDLKRIKLKAQLEAIGLDLISDRLNQLIEKTKHLILRKARNEISGDERKHKLSYYLTEKLSLDYSYLSHLFSSYEGRTIENYFIEQRIEKAKELLVYGELNLSEIAHELDYSSVAHLSTQFKKTTGLTPSHFKNSGKQKLKSLDQV
jgi:AraC-like DNA-binding protein